MQCRGGGGFPAGASCPRGGGHGGGGAGAKRPAGRVTSGELAGDGRHDLGSDVVGGWRQEVHLFTSLSVTYSTCMKGNIEIKM
jgi:hypothetical protein